MSTFGKITEKVKIDKALAPQDIDSAQSSDWFDMAGYRRAIAVLVTEEISDGEEVTLKINEAKDDSGDSDQELDEIVVEADGNEELKIELEISTDDMTDGYTHIQVEAEADSADDAAAILLRSDKRYK